MNDLEDYKLYTVEKDGKTIKLKTSQLKASVLSKVFSLFPESIVLISQDGYVETAGADGVFHQVDDLPVWSVSGDLLVLQSGSSLPGPSGLSHSHILGKRRGGKLRCNLGIYGQARLPGVCSQEVGESSTTSGAEWNKSIDICRWVVREKSWKKVSNLPVMLTDATANVPSVSQMVAFGGEDIVLLDTDYLKIPDTLATKG